jgi:Fic family protein
MPTPRKKIIPFVPRAFPPRGLNKKAIAKPLEKANRLLEKYRLALMQAPSPERLFSQLFSLEAIASVASQKVHTTLEKFLTTNHPKLLLVAHYKEALLWACKKTRRSPLTKGFLCTIHKKAKSSTKSKADLGVYRNRQNWIGPEGCKIEDAYFYPPDKSKVKGLMKELLVYAKKKEKEPLVQLALWFAQFLIIHPFMDGNGRVARILVPIFLYQKKVIPVPLLFMSRYLFRHRVKYFQNLFNNTENHQWEPWILFFLKSLTVEMNRALGQFKQIVALHDEIRQKLPAMRSKALYFLFERPIFSKNAFRGAMGSDTDLRGLEELGCLKKKGSEYKFSSLLKVLKK